MRNKSLIALTESAFMAGLSVILSFIIIWKMPQGGIITLGCMLPIIIISIRRGVLFGILTGAVSGILQFLIFGVTLHPLSILLDYIIAYGIVGIVGLFKTGYLKITFGTMLAVFCKLFIHILSGATIFASYAPVGQNPWIYSIIYNAAYMIPECIITIVELLILYTFASKLFYPRL